TGEELPKYHSVRARLGIIEIQKPLDPKNPSVNQGSGDYLDQPTLTACQTDARAGLYAQTMAAYVRWIAARYEALQEERRLLLGELRQKFQECKSHARTPGLIGDLWWGWKTFLCFTVDEGALSQSEATAYQERAYAGLVAMGRQQVEHQESEEIAGRFLT